MPPISTTVLNTLDTYIKLLSKVIIMYLKPDSFSMGKHLLQEDPYPWLQSHTVLPLHFKSLTVSADISSKQILLCCMATKSVCYY